MLIVILDIVDRLFISFNQQIGTILIHKFTQMKKLPTLTQPQNNFTLLKRLQTQYMPQISEMDQLFLVPNLTINNLSRIRSIISKLLFSWTQLELTQAKLTSLSLDQFQNPQNGSQSILLTCFPASLISYDFSVKCQISGSLPHNPARTNTCSFICVVEKKVLQEYGVCSCGREVEKYENEVVEDWVLRYLVRFYDVMRKQADAQIDNSRKLQNKLTQLATDKNIKWNGSIRVHLDQKEFKFIQDSQFLL